MHWVVWSAALSRSKRHHFTHAHLLSRLPLVALASALFLARVLLISSRAVDRAFEFVTLHAWRVPGARLIFFLEHRALLAVALSTCRCDNGVSGKSGASMSIRQVTTHLCNDSFSLPIVYCQNFLKLTHQSVLWGSIPTLPPNVTVTSHDFRCNIFSLECSFVSGCK